VDSAGGRTARSEQLVWPLYWVAFLSNFTIGARVLIIPLDARHLGQSPATVGLLYAAFAGVGALTSLPAGLLIDRRGSRSILLVGLAVSCAAQVLATTDSLPVLFASQVLSGVSWGMAQLSIITAALNASPSLKLGRVLGLTSLGNQTGLMAGPAVAGFLVGWLGFGHLLLLFALPALAGLVVVLLTVRHRFVKLESQSAWASSLVILRRPGMVPIALLAASIGVVWGTFQAYFAIFAASGLHLTAIGVGALIAIAGLANAFSRIPAGRLLDRLPSKGVATALGVTAFGAGLVALPHLQNFWLIAVLLSISVPLYGLAIMGMSLAAMALGGTAGRGRTIGVMSALFSLASAAAPAAFGTLMNASFAAGFAAAGLTGAAIAAGALLIRRRVMRAAAAARFSAAPDRGS
jgi:DHA1 family solute carrier family 18 vesicular amine transporter 1/2